MSEIDYVIREIKVGQEAVFNMAELYEYIKSWFVKHRYVFFEKEYLEFLKEGGKSASIKWQAQKKIDDYVKFHIEARIKFKDIKEVKGGKANLVKGSISFKFESFLEKDYEDNWEINFISKFMRSIYDKFIIRDKIGRLENELREETYEVFNEVKAFLKLHQYKA